MLNNSCGVAQLVEQVTVNHRVGGSSPSTTATHEPRQTLTIKAVLNKVGECMAILDILKFPDSRLRRKCTPVQEITPDLIQLADDMLETMSASHGLGLSAIQVNHFVRLLTTDTRILYPSAIEAGSARETSSAIEAGSARETGSTIEAGSAIEAGSTLGNERYSAQEIGFYEQKICQPLVLFNPHIISYSGEVIFKEGCLSFPSYYAEVKRSALIEVVGLDKAGQEVKIKTDGVLAICLQHEIDHLNGKLFIDHLSPLKAERLRTQIKKYGYPTDRRDSTDDSV